MADPNIDALNNYVNEVRDRPFQWHVNDCFMFTNTAFQRMYGAGWADDWIGKYMTNGLYLKRDALRRIFNAKSLIDAIDQKLTRISYVPPRGALITTKGAKTWVIGEALGISMGSSGAFLGDKGLIFMPIENISNAWVKNG